MHRRNVFMLIAAFFYLLDLICVVFIVPRRERHTLHYEYHIIPLQSTLAQIHDPAQYNTPGYWKTFTVSIAGNFLLFLPFGFLASYLFPSKKVTTIFSCGVITSVIIELIQLLSHSGVCDIDDVLLNSLGCIAGIFCYRGFAYFTKKSASAK